MDALPEESGVHDPLKAFTFSELVALAKAYAVEEEVTRAKREAGLIR